jgi:hypothetical protein
MKTICANDIEQLRTPDGGFNAATMRLFGMWPLTEGWQQRMIGLRVSDKTWREAQKAKRTQLHRFRGNTRKRA